MHLTQWQRICDDIPRHLAGWPFPAKGESATQRQVRFESLEVTEVEHDPSVRAAQMPRMLQGHASNPATSYWPGPSPRYILQL